MLQKVLKKKLKLFETDDESVEFLNFRTGFYMPEAKVLRNEQIHFMDSNNAH